MDKILVLQGLQIGTNPTAECRNRGPNSVSLEEKAIANVGCKAGLGHSDAYAHTLGHSEKPSPAFNIHPERFLPEESPAVRSIDMASEACWLYLSLGAPGKPHNLRDLSFPICKMG